MSNQDQNSRRPIVHIIRYISPAKMHHFFIFVYLSHTSYTFYSLNIRMM